MINKYFPIPSRTMTDNYFPTPNNCFLTTSRVTSLPHPKSYFNISILFICSGCLLFVCSPLFVFQFVAQFFCCLAFLLLSLLFIELSLSTTEYFSSNHLFCRRCQSSRDVQYQLYCFRSHMNHLIGHVVVAECPRSWQKNAVRQKCVNCSSNNPINNIPVFDHSTRTTFLNAYCAICNKAKNFTYWQIQFKYSEANKLNAKNLSLKDIFKKNLNWIAKEYPTNSTDSCIPTPAKPRVLQTTRFSQKNITELWLLCKTYSLQVFNGCSKKVKNPHCGQMINIKPTTFPCSIRFSCDKNIPSLSILFTLKPNSFTDSSRQTSETKVVRYSCSNEAIYDPFTDSCERFSLSRVNIFPKIMVNETQRRLILCNGERYNETEYVVFDNGSIFLFSRRTMLPNSSYIVTSNGAVLCKNTSSDVYNTSSTNVKSIQNTKSYSGSSILTLVGSLISIACLICFIITRALFKELRTWNGKNLMSLASAMLIFQLFFLFSGYSDVTIICDVITGIVHFALLAIFTWTSVIAHDVSRKFTSSGKCLKCDMMEVIKL